MLDVEPELERLLTDEQRDQAQRFALTATTLDKGTDVIAFLERAQAFGAIVLDGVLFQNVQIEERVSLRLIGPGGVVPFAQMPQATPPATLSVRAATRSRIAVLDDSFLVATHHWPHLTALLHARAMEQSARLSIQLAISHLSRVEDRLMAVMWLLAEHWGQVTPAGIRLQLSLTHDTLGALIGAQRPTVTLALKKLAESGSLIRQHVDWLILAPPPEPGHGEHTPSRLLEETQSSSARKSGSESEPARERPAVTRAELVRMRAHYAQERQRSRELQGEARELRAQTRKLVDNARTVGEPPTAPRH